jgi:ADP-dependent NAD(P)H-hydrate dehydratase / NAD(P)H-hydrate epimerase
MERYALSPDQMQALDAFAIAQGLPALVLMERAALSMRALLAEYLREQWTDFSSASPRCTRHISIFCGTGNNGGDGLALARLFQDAPWKTFVEVRVYLVGDPQRCRSENQQQQTILAAMGIEVISLTEIADLVQVKSSNPHDICIDALMGVGLNRPLEGLLAALIAELNQWPALRVALDIPSGIHGATGAVMGAAFCAHLTLSCAQFKQGQLCDAALAYVGALKVADIGIPEVWLNAHAQQQSMPLVKVLSPETFDSFILPYLPVRAPSTHKGSQGKLGVFGGSQGMIGALMLSLRAALESGPGYIFAYTDPELVSGLAPVLPEVQINGFPCVEALEETLSQLDFVLIGPGLGRSETTKAYCHCLFDMACTVNVPVLVDADGLYFLPQWLSEGNTLPAGSIVTPHPGEAAHLLGMKTTEVQADRFTALKRLQQLTGVICVLKGACTLIALSATDLYVNTTGNAGLARGGSGDVLAGMMAGLAHQSEGAAIVATYWHGLTADDVAEHYGMQGVRIQRLCDTLSEVWASLCVR